MIIFLRNIPAHTRQSDIIAFVKPALKVSFIYKKGIIENIKVLQLKDSRTNISGFHGLVTIQPDVAASRVIKRLNRKKFLNKYIAVREYYLRDWHNDSRINYDLQSSFKPEKRLAGRRRSSIEVVEEKASTFSSNEVFHRSF